jgi:metal-responsive CopG/Arc/MetJ family transcriptional regulator
MDLVDRIVRAIKDQMLQCSMSLPEGLVEEADRLGDQAVETSNEVIDRARRALLSFVPEEKIKNIGRVEPTPPPNYKPSAL